jgi:predicted transcriptional regulator
LAHVLLAIKPRFVELILSGKKVVEVRRGGTSIKAGDVLILYSSSPERSVRATCAVGAVETQTVRSALAAMNGRTGLSEEELQDYLSGAETATLLSIESVFRLSRPVPLKELRSGNRRMVIPQSYRFLNDVEIETLAPYIKS